MRLLLEENWNDFVRNNKGQELLLFGASSCADKFLNRLNVKFSVKYLMDNDEKKWMDLYDGKYKICSPETCKKESEDSVLVITSTYWEEIIEQLQSIGFAGTVYSFLHLRNKVSKNADFEDLEINIKRLKEILADEKSKCVLDSIMEKRKTRNKDYKDICEGSQYFPEGIISVENGLTEVFVDGGAFDGETVKEFIRFTGDDFKKVYSFEMDKDNFEKINTTDFDDRVKFYNYGLWSKNTKLSFVVSERSSEVAEDGLGSADCVAIDEFINEKVTFIKMDIEGAEMEALIGAKETIKKYTPKLAICLYHKFSDLWEIPFYISNLVPEYKFYIRHHSEKDEGTVLYAVI